MTKRSPQNFLYFASGDQAHKGLDLLLEVFSERDFPYSLFICSTFKSEKEFCSVYQKELYETKNIHAVGFADIMGDEFHKILERCAYVIVPSCSEGQMGSALTVMSAGVIPILSKVCGFNEDEVILLPDCEIETIKSYVLAYAQKDRAWLREESERVLALTHSRYTQEAFIRSIQKGLEGVLQEKIDIPKEAYDQLIHEA
jgi:glycosyltransferase, family 1